ncbi:MAG: type II toxin-antitoxin system RelE/ParE family toxin [Sphaerospermopsis sp.]|nr:type II toxin-antitoxin system RelE/ParE family toxin [Sphaerospermopsis sp.]
MSKPNTEKTTDNGNGKVYIIEFAPKAIREFSKLTESVQEEITIKIDSLAFDPRPPGVKKLKGEKNKYRIRTGNYRIIYSIEDSKLLVLVLSIGDRKEVYKNM